METQDNIPLKHQAEVKSNYVAGNYHQPQADGADQTVLVDPAITDELDPSFQQQSPPVDPEEDEDEKDQDQQDQDEDDFPAREDLEDDDLDLNRDEEDDLSLNMDEDELN